MGEADASPTPTPVGHVHGQRDKGLKLVKTTTGYVKCAAYLQGRLERIAILQLSSRKLAVSPARCQRFVITKNSIMEWEVLRRFDTWGRYIVSPLDAHGGCRFKDAVNSDHTTYSRSSHYGDSLRAERLQVVGPINLFFSLASM